MIVKDINNADFTFTPKRLTLRKFRELLELIEALQESTKHSSTITLLEQGLSLCLNAYDPETSQLDFSAAMEIMSETVKVNRVSVAERKKSE